MSSRVNILGVGVHAVALPAAVEQIERWIQTRQPSYVVLAPAHAIMAARRDPDLRRIANRSGLTVPDGMAVVWLLRLWGHGRVGRVYGPDLMLALCSRSPASGYRHYFYGAAPGVAAELARRLQVRFHGLIVAGTHSPPFSPAVLPASPEEVQRIQAASPDIVWVGLGSPKQERWMAEYRPHLDAPVLIGVGAAFDFLSGRKPQAPRWVRAIGLEWLFRLATEPRRLAGRYAEYPLFALLAGLQLLRLRRYEAD
jgi:N-acetylglucosaminyldiphosphoundecaprenol N-acetyl-beta-D-mannosaminyltransferase